MSAFHADDWGSNPHSSISVLMLFKFRANRVVVWLRSYRGAEGNRFVQ